MYDHHSEAKAINWEIARIIGESHRPVRFFFLSIPPACTLKEEFDIDKHGTKKYVWFLYTFLVIIGVLFPSSKCLDRDPASLPQSLSIQLDRANYGLLSTFLHLFLALFLNFSDKTFL